MVPALLDMMPAKDHPTDDIVIVLSFRTPRFDHLFSVWQQKQREHRQAESFKDWICAMDCGLPEEEKLDLRVVDTLGQAAVFRSYGFHVVIIDMAGVKRDN